MDGDRRVHEAQMKSKKFDCPRSEEHPEESLLLSHNSMGAADDLGSQVLYQIF
jgi:hypothetical protein